MERIFKRVLMLIVAANFIFIMIQFISGNNNRNILVYSIAPKDSLEMIKEKGELTVSTPLNDYPFFYINPNTNKLSGIDAEIINEIGRRLGINKVEMRETVFSNLLEKLNADTSIDMAAGGIYITPQREKLVSFTVPLYKETEIVVVPQYSNINFRDDLKNSLVGVEKGTVFAELAQKWKDNNSIRDVVFYDNTSDLLNDVNNSKVDAAIADCLGVNDILAKNKKLFLRPLKDYKPELPGNIGIAVRKNDVSLLLTLNKIINEMRADGTLYAILVENGLDKSNMIIN